MPGHEDLIKQNIAKASVRANVENAGEQRKTAGEKPTYSSHRSLLGGNLDVASALDSIEFAVKGPLGDGALRNSVAYIRYWSRPGSKTTAESASQTVDATQLDPAADSQAQLQQKLRESYLLPKTFVNSPAADYLADTYKYRDVRANDRVAENFFDFYSSGKGGAEVGVQGDTTGDLPLSNVTLSTDLAKQKSRQDDLLVEVPRVDGNKYLDGVFKPGLSVAGFDQKYNVDFTAYKLPGVGQLKPANPNGFVNTISKIGKSSPGNKPGQIGYQGAAGAANGGKAALAKSGTLAKGMWQFLFNPSELEITAGPEFKAAETWGVSDKGNSGQPLNWSHNKNAELKFNSVLLNGYVFGRKVEELEQGIFELFMSREGEGQAGPPILEFVWGKRVFGPCVIKDISIKEKMWDEGMVVNAELSFTLEQIPEWTINDGYVDVARPGKIPMVYDPTEENKDTTAPGPDTNPSNPGDPGSPDQKPPAPAGQKPGDAKLCDWAINISKQFQQLYVRVNNPLTAAAFGNFNGQVSQFYSLKGSLYSGSGEIGGFVDTKVSSGCKRSSYQATVENLKKSGGGGGISPQQQTIQFIRGCTESTKRAIDEWHRTSAKCKAQREAGAANRVKQEQSNLCAKYAGRCDRPGERFGTAGQCPFVNNNRGVICSGGVWTPL